MNNIILNEEVRIEDMIYEVRGLQVILASDVAKLYNSETKIINQVVKRNINRFPEHFCFQLTNEKYYSLRSQNVTSKEYNHVTRGGNRYLPYAFTEHGIMMLSGLLKNDIAVEVNVKIINAFVAMRKYISSSLIEQKYINELVLKDTKRIDLIELTLAEFKEKNNHLFFKGQIYDAYSLLIDIFNKSKKEIIVIDNYVDKSILDILSKTNKNVKIYTNKYNNQDYEKYKMQYKNVDLIIINTFHDRFIIIDKKLLYHCGASFKDLGKHCFEISKIEDNDILDNLLKKL